MMLFLANILAFIIALYAIAKRVFLISEPPFVDHSIIKFTYQHLELLDKQISDQGGQRNIKPKPITANRTIFSPDAKWEAAGDPKSGNAYIVVSEKPLFDPKSAGYDISEGRLFFLDEYGQYYCFPWDFSFISEPILWHKIRLIYLIYPDTENNKIKTIACKISLMPYFLTMRELSKK